MQRSSTGRTYSKAVLYSCTALLGIANSGLASAQASDSSAATSANAGGRALLLRNKPDMPLPDMVALSGELTSLGIDRSFESRSSGSPADGINGSTADTAETTDLAVPRALPSGAEVVFGTVGFTRSAPTTLVVRQSTDRAIVNWQSFDIAAGNTVDVQQPGTESRALFRVTGNTDSRIAGALTATGKLFLINPNGIAIGAGATINTGSFVASTLDIADADFLSGNFTFRRTGAAKGIFNGGTISANGGDVALLGSSVLNEGVVSARLGRIAYGAGDAITLDFGGDRFLQIAVPVSDAGALKDVFGRDLAALVTTAGRSEAQGGQIYLSARAARDLMTNAVRIEDDLIATSFKQAANGQIRLGSVKIDGGDGVVQTLGKIDASGGAGLTGGAVSITGRVVALGGEISASGERGGGSVTVDASGVLSLAATVDATALRGDGGTIRYTSGGSITENVGGISDVSGGLSGGTIRVSGGGDVATSGTYRADGLLGLGGNIDIAGRSIRLLSTQFSARGLKQGGLVRVGGAFQGGAADRTQRADYERFEGRFDPLAPIGNALTTFVNDGVRIDVSSSRGIGGGAIIWSDRQTTMLGALSATGVRGGGTAEVSGKDELRYVDLSTINTGVGGQLLLDPSFIVIGDFAQASSWQYAAIIGTGVAPGVPGVGDLEVGDSFGRSVSLNAMGDRLAVGANDDAGFGNVAAQSGSVRLFTFANTSFGGGTLAGTIGRGYTGTGNIDLGAALEGSDRFGISVSLNAAGDRLAVGAVFDSGFNNNVIGAGSVRLFTFANTSFGGGALAGTIGRDYTGTGNIDLGAALASGDQFGTAVSLNAAGDRLAVGARLDDGFGDVANSAGAVRLFTFADTSFGGGTLAGTIGRGYTGPGNTDLGTMLESGDNFGSAVSLNAAGDRLAVGAFADDGFTNVGAGNSGSVRLFTFADTSFGGGALAGTIGRDYTGPGNTDLGTTLESGDNFGSAVSLNAAGDRLAVGASGDRGFDNSALNAGSVRLFTFANTSFGGGALAGTIGRGYTGASNLDLGATLEGGDQFGTTVSLNAAGDRLAVGAVFDAGIGNLSDRSGSVRLFTFGDTSFGSGALVGTLGLGYSTGFSIDLGTALEPGDDFGSAVSLNAAGDRLAVGAFNDQGSGNVANRSGSVRLFTFANTGFGGGALAGTIGRGYTGAGNLDLGTALEALDLFGASVSLNAAGDRLAVGARNDDGFGNIATDSGSVRLFTFANTSFGGAALAGTIGRGYAGIGDLNLGATLEQLDLFGTSVSLNAAGDRLAVGAVGDAGSGNVANSSGSVRLFTFANASFGGGALAGTFGRGYAGVGNFDLGTALETNDQFGSAVSLNAAGDRLAVGAALDDGFGNGVSNIGSVRLFTFADTSFGGATLAGTIGRGYTGGGDLDLGTALETDDQFGSSVALNAAGDRLAVGANFDDGFSNIAMSSGSVRLFTFTNASFGGAALAGTIGRGYTGAGNLDLGTALEAGDRFGSSVSLNAAGNRLAIGATMDDGFSNVAPQSGSVRLITFANTSFGGGALAGTIGRGFTGGGILDVGIALESNDQFGFSVSLNAAGNRLAVGARQDSGFGNVASTSGAVRLFTFANTSFGGGALAGTIGRGYTGAGNLDLGTALETNDQFGFSVSLNAAGNRLAAGAPLDRGSSNVANGSGSVRLFTFTDTSFGGGALAGTIGRGYVGAGDLNLGAALEASDQFGSSVSLNAAGDRLAVGAPLDDAFANGVLNSGSVRLFTFTNASFGGGALEGTIGRGYAGAGDLDPGVTLGASDTFGSSVSLNAAGDRLAVGASGDDGFGDVANSAGAVRLFSFANTSFGSGALAGTIGRGYTGGGNLDLGTALESGDGFGTSVALNAAGDRLAVGARQDDGFGNIVSGSGSVRLFTFANTSFGGGALAGTIGRGYTGVNDFDTTGGPFLQIGDAVAFNADASSLVLSSPTNDIVVALRRGAGTGIGNLLFADNPTGTSNISVAALQAALSTGQAISFEASNDITLQSNLVVNNTSGAGGALSLRAGRSILLNASITTDDANLTLIANSGGSDLATVNANRLAGAAAITMAPGTSINAGSGAVSISLTSGAGLTTPTSGAITLGSITASALSVSNAGLTTGSDIIVRAGSLLTASGAGRAIDIRAATGTFTNNAGAGLFNLTGGGSYAVFSDAPATTLEGVTGYLKRYNVADANAFAALNPGGNFFAYRIAPVLTVTADNFTRVYGNANPSFTFGITGFIDGDTAAGSLTGAPSLTTLAAQFSNIGNYAIAAALGTLVSAEGYQFNFAPGTLTVTARPLTVTADALTRIYGNANPALTFTIGGQGLVNGDTLTGALATTAGLTSNIGAYAITQGSLAASTNYALTYNGANLTVTARPLTITADALSRIYGNANPALTFAVGGQGLVNGDTLTGALATTAGLTSNVGGYAITQGSLAASTNYALSYNGANLTVTARPLTVTADALSRIYGNANPALTFTVGGQGLVNGDTLTGALATTAGLASGVGAYAITQGSLAASSNYALTYTGANLTVTARPLTVTADALSRIYGNANPALTFTVGGQGLVNGDTLSGALATAAGQTSNVGTYAITQGTLAASSNYALTYNGANLTVTARPLTITADALSRIYGNANPALTFTVGGQGLVNGDTLTGALATTAGLASGVGAYAITQGSLAASSNYALTYTGANLTVTARPLTVTADALSRIYGNANPALTFTVGGQGLVNGDTLSGALATAAGQTSNVGTYAITQGTLAASSNYALTYNGANLTVTARPLTITADALSRIYGNANPALTFTVGGQGLVNGDTLTGALATTAGLTSNVGAYAITQGSLAASTNYALTYNGANLTVTARPLTVTADALSRIYGNANPALTFAVGGQGLVNGDTLTGALATTAGLTSNVGAYAITQGTLAVGSNYALTYNGANLTVTARPLTISADALSRIYGNVNPALTFTVGGQGLVNGDTLTGALATAAGQTSNVGAYAITQGTLAASSNYALTYNGANLTVTARPLTITADALSRIYGNANPALTFAVGGLGLVNGDTLTGALATTAGQTSNVGAYAITQGSLAAGSNYALTYNGANLTVTARPLTTTADALTRIYGNANPALTFTIGGQGLVNGDTLSGSLATVASTTSNVGAYAITQGTLAASSNYALTYTGANLTVMARPLTITADALSRIYGNANQALTFTVGGQDLVNGDTLSGALATTAGLASGVGVYAITRGTLAAGSNYALTYVGNNLTVTARPLTVTADALSRIYANANPALTFTVGGQGLVNGDTLTGALATAAGQTSNVGAYAITQGTLAASSNYALTYNGANLTVTARPLTITADALSRIYGNANPALTFTVGGQGLVNGDTLIGALATTAGLTSNVGAYAITQGTLAASSNYALTYNGANLTVTPRAIVITADTLAKIFGSLDPVLTFRVGGAGLVNGDRLAGVLRRDAGEATGRYTIRQGTLANFNYTIAFVPGTFTINPATTLPELSLSPLENALPVLIPVAEPALVPIDADDLFLPFSNLPNLGCPIAVGGVCVVPGD
jgi:filamentous hemagglutinin family protein